MTNVKTTRKALFSSMIALVLCFAMLMGTTFAWFTDSVSSVGNTINSGTLKVDIVDAPNDTANSLVGEGKALAFVDDADTVLTDILWEPGCRYLVQKFYIKNAGNLALKYNIVVTGATGDDTSLMSQIDWYVVTTTGDVALAEYDFSKIDGVDASLNAGEYSDAIQLMGVMKTSAGNEWQNKSVDGITINVVATQYTTESDSFDNTYDEGAYYPKTVEVEGSDKAAVLAAINSANPGDTIVLTEDATISGYAANNKLVIDKAIILDLNGNTITTECGWGGIDAKGGCSIINGTINHTGNTAAIKAFQVETIENVTINVTETAGKTKGGIVIQEGAGCYVGSIKNVTITGATNGIETYRCGARDDLAIGSMENVTIDATDTGISLSAPIGTVTNCSIEGNNIGINAYLYGPYSVSIDLVNSTVTGATGIYAHDEVGKTNPGTLTITYDDATVITDGITQEFETEVADRVYITQ